MKNIKVLITGRFNVLHLGHIRLFKFAKEIGDYLYVGVESDEIAGTNAYIKDSLRLEGIISNKYVDDSFIFNDSIEEIIEKYEIDIVVKGKEHETRFNPEHEVLKKRGGKLIFSSGETFFNSIDSSENEMSNLFSNSIKIPSDYLLRHHISINKLLNYLSKFSDLSICIIGDLIVDEYITCEALGMSQEDPTIVVTPIDATKYIGGASIVAAHASCLGANVNFISVAGDDANRQFAIERLKKYNVNSNIFVDSNRPTTLKKRYRCKSKTLLRVSHLHQDEISLSLQELIYKQVEKIIQKIDLLVFSDFNYGCLPQNLVNRIIKLAKSQSKNIFLAADSQSSSQIGDISRFKGMSLITPTEHEARISTKNSQDGLVVLASDLKSLSICENILLKLGGDGLLIHACETQSENFLTDRISALNIAPKDVSGAGDSLLITSAMTLASGGDIWEAAILGSVAASIQVGRIGNTPLEVSEFYKIFSK